MLCKATYDYKTSCSCTACSCRWVAALYTLSPHGHTRMYVHAHIQTHALTHGQGLDLKRHKHTYDTYMSSLLSADAAITVTDYCRDEVEVVSDITKDTLHEFLKQPRPSWSKARKRALCLPQHSSQQASALCLLSCASCGIARPLCLHCIAVYLTPTQPPFDFKPRPGALDQRARPGLGRHINAGDSF
jgi:hypothetical protein